MCHAGINCNNRLCSSIRHPSPYCIDELHKVTIDKDCMDGLECLSSICPYDHESPARTKIFDFVCPNIRCIDRKCLGAHMSPAIDNIEFMEWYSYENHFSYYRQNFPCLLTRCNKMYCSNGHMPYIVFQTCEFGNNCQNKDCSKNHITPAYNGSIIMHPLPQRCVNDCYGDDELCIFSHSSSYK
jgi:hypothetical protein